MAKITFADVVHEQLVFDTSKSHHKLVLELIETAWVQRLRDIAQTANTRLVYIFSEHSRFGHSLGVADLACRLIDQLMQTHPEVGKYALGIAAAALLHDIGHLAPGSHTAQKAWFKNKPDEHELTSSRIILEDLEIKKILLGYDQGLPKLVTKILEEHGFAPTNITRINHKEFDLITIKKNKVYNFQCKNNFIDISRVNHDYITIGRYNRQLCRYYEKALVKEEKRENLVINQTGIKDIEHFVISRYPVITRNLNIINFTDLERWVKK